MRRRPIVFIAGLCLVLASGPAQAQAPRAAAEWEPTLGTLVRWPFNLPANLTVELAADDLLYVVLDNATQQTAAQAELAGNGANMSNVIFIQTPVFSPWTRDWGPFGVFDPAGNLQLVDAGFEDYPWVPGCPSSSAATVSRPVRPRKRTVYADDDQVPLAVGATMGLPVQPLDVLLTGGNFMTDGRGLAYSSLQMLDENLPTIDQATFLSRVNQTMGIDDYRFVPNPEDVGIQHIDCWAKFLDEETVLVQEVAPDHPEYDCYETVASEFVNALSSTGRPYRVERIFCERYDGDETAAYTNSLILNQKVLVPMFGIGEDQVALQRYRDLMPGYQVIGFHYGPGWFYYDALHCRTKEIYDPGMLRLQHDRLLPQVAAGVPHRVEVLIDDRSEAGLVPGAQTLSWRVAGGAWQAVALVDLGNDRFQAYLPAQPEGTDVEYYFSAADNSGRSETQPRVAPGGVYSFTTVAQPTAVPNLGTISLAVSPNPFNPRTTIRFELDRPRQVQLRVLDLQGRLVATLADGAYPRGQSEVTWEGRDRRGRGLSSGTYFVQLRSGPHRTSTKVVLVR